MNRTDSRLGRSWNRSPRIRLVFRRRRSIVDVECWYTIVEAEVVFGGFDPGVAELGWSRHVL